MGSHRGQELAFELEAIHDLLPSPSGVRSHLDRSGEETLGHKLRDVLGSCCCSLKCSEVVLAEHVLGGLEIRSKSLDIKWLPNWCSHYFHNRSHSSHMRVSLAIVQEA
jgi:hypothetical protein